MKLNKRPGSAVAYLNGDMPRLLTENCNHAGFDPSFQIVVNNQKSARPNFYFHLQMAKRKNFLCEKLCF
jgi:hypothetical protein